MKIFWISDLVQAMKRIRKTSNVSVNYKMKASFIITDGSDASALLGTLDSAFLFTYAAAMFLRYEYLCILLRYNCVL